MLAELHVRDLGVIAGLDLVLGEGMTALTGETGAGKTLVVEAIELLVGERADAVLVRPGADEARVEGRFVDAFGDETVLARVVPKVGRSRAYVDGRLATAAELAERGRGLVDLYGQHASHSLLRVSVQRAALDRFGGVELAPLAEARARVASAARALDALGGDARSRGRELDLLRFQLDELAAAGLADPEEDRRLQAEEEALASAAASRQAAAEARAALADDGGAADALGRAVGACAGRPVLAELEERLRTLQAEAGEAAADLRRAGEGIVDDPERLEAVRSRRRLLRDLCRKYGDVQEQADVSQVMAYEAEARDRLAQLESHGQRMEGLEAERAAATGAVARAAAAVAAARRRAAPRLAAEIQEHLRGLAMPAATLEVSVDGPDPGDEVTFLLAANPGDPPLPLAKVASGGELARTMLAARLVLTVAPPTLVFDEVDAGIGGQAALAVGRALAELATRHQVLVVTHLPQVAAFADHQVAVTKDEREGGTVAAARPLVGHDRVVELSRMLSGQPASLAAQDHAEELLATAWRERGR